MSEKKKRSVFEPKSFIFMLKPNDPNPPTSAALPMAYRPATSLMSLTLPIQLLPAAVRLQSLHQTWANYDSRSKSGPPVLLFWPAGAYTNLNSHRELRRRSYFSLEIINVSAFQKNKPQWCKIGIKNEKNEMKTFYFRDHIRTWTVISEKKRKKVFTLFSNQRAARRVNSFFKI